MASGTKSKKHKCSCGRSFRHAISLKRHRNVTGCEAVVEADEATPVSVSLDAEQANIVEPTAPVTAEDDRAIVITPELVACWQEQTGFQRRTSSVVDSIAPKKELPKIDWLALANTGRAFYEFCNELKNDALDASRNAVVVVARGSLFLSVLLFSGWFLVTGVSASTAPGVDTDGRSQLAAQNVVEDFLQNAKLNHYDRARRLLAPGARQSVTVEQLQMMINSLPLNHAPTAWSTELSSDRSQARVIVARDGLDEVYTLVQSDTGWGLTSVSIANS